MNQRPIIDAGPSLNFLSVNQERLLIRVLGQLSVPETVQGEVLRKASQDTRFRAAGATWRKLTPKWVQGSAILACCRGRSGPDLGDGSSVLQSIDSRVRSAAPSDVVVARQSAMCRSFGAKWFRQRTAGRQRRANRSRLDRPR